MWKFKNRRKPTEQFTESIPTTINERQIVDSNDNGGVNNNNSNSNDASDKRKLKNVNGENNKEQDDNSIFPNHSMETSHSVDAMLAKELNALSFQQRESINEEIHGINVNQIYKEIEETPELLKKSFAKFQLELNKLQPNSFAYDRCQRLYGSSSNNNTHGRGDNNNGTTKSRRKSYINTDAFRIMFLRCDLFDATKAARRLINFVELMYKLYGDVGIQRRIRLEDFSEEEIRVLKLGRLQILPGRDRAGRRIWINIGYNSTNAFTVKSRLRLSFYFQMSLADDIETQRKGFVGITWWHNVNMFDDFSARGKVYSALANCAPVRNGSIHTCIAKELEDTHYSSAESSDTMSPQSRRGTPANIIKSMLALSMNQKLRSKLRFHSGSAMECLYAVQSFGIPSNQIPVNVNTVSKKKRRRIKIAKKSNDDIDENDDNNGNKNNIKLENHIKWLKLCQLKENNMKLFGVKWKYNIENYHGFDKQIIACQKLKNRGNDDQQIIECPKHNDILSGRGKDIMRHPGNSLLRSIVDSKLQEYINLKSNKETTKLTFDIVHLLKKKHRVRFLKEETIESEGKLGCWFEITDEQARLKVRVIFRDKIKVQQQQQTQPQPPPKMNQQQQQQQQTQLLQSPPPMQSPILMPQQIQHQQDQEGTDSSTSMFVSMTGDSSGCGCGSGSGSGSISSSGSTTTTYSGKKRQLQTHIVCFNKS